MNSESIPSKFIEKIAGDDGTTHFTVNLLVSGLHCPSCVNIIESALYKHPEIVNARLNLTTKRLKITYKSDPDLVNQYIQEITKMGYVCAPFDPNTEETLEQSEEKFLLKCLAVAGFASGNLMLFSIPMWSASNFEMGGLTRNMFQWIQILIAVPAIIYSGIPFYRSAFSVLRMGRTNMDVPISVAVILATLLSIFEIIQKGHHAYLDSGVMLLFFLLIGRYLDAKVRSKAKGAASDLLKMMQLVATVIDQDGKHVKVTMSEIQPGMVLSVAVGERIAADSVVQQGESAVDTSLITGETIPTNVVVGSNVFAGTINIAAPLKLLVSKATDNSLISSIVKLMETAEQSKSYYVTIADKVSAWYTPFVHILALLTFLGWVIFTAATWQQALLIAATVLIITCPCALGLAVPVVQVLASSILMRQGILLKSSTALERLNEIDYVVFDKTGTLTLGKPKLLDPTNYTGDVIKMAVSLAKYSKHPLAVALSEEYKGTLFDLKVEEIPASGLKASYKGQELKLGSRKFCAAPNNITDDQMELWLTGFDKNPIRFLFTDQVRPDAKDVVESLHNLKYPLKLLSGDLNGVVQKVALELGMNDYCGLLSPVAKCEILEKLKQDGHKILMVGDGLNDAPSLALAHIAMSPASAADITQNVADIVFQGSKLEPVIVSIKIAKSSQILVKQNFVLAMIYNIIAIPLAVLGYVTPLIAAIAMSTSSIVVILNALRLNRR